MKNQHFNRWIVYQCAICHNYVNLLEGIWSRWSRFSADLGSVIAALRTGMESWWALRPLHAKLEPRFPQVAQFCRSWWLQAATAGRQQWFEVRELFKRLPVRHKEFMKNAKSQATCRHTIWTMVGATAHHLEFLSSLGPRQRIIKSKNFKFRFTKFLKKFSTSLLPWPLQIGAVSSLRRDRSAQLFDWSSPMPLHSPRCVSAVSVFGQFWGSGTWAKTKWETFRFLVTCRKSEVSAVYIYIYPSIFRLMRLMWDSWVSTGSLGFRFASASWLRSAAVPAGAAPRCSAPQA